MGLRGPPPPPEVKGGQGQGLSLVSGRAQGCVRGGRGRGRERAKKIRELEHAYGCVKMEQYVCIGDL